MDPFVQRVREIRIGSKYQLLRKLGSGSFGKVYLGRDVTTDQEVAIKLEHHDVDPSLLDEELDVYQALAGRPGFPQIFWHGSLHDFNILVFELLGPNLDDLHRYCGGRFSLKTTLMLADQLLRRFQHLHSHRYLHRDVKPENFLLGLGRRGNVVYMTDFGLALYRRTSQPGGEESTRTSAAVTERRREPPARPPQLLGTCRYASINGHLGVAQSQRDDLEALGYMLVYLIKGKLPWQGLKASTSAERHLRVLEMKQSITIDDLCADLPHEFAVYMDYVRGMREEAMPDYRRLRKLFSDLFRRQGFENDNVFDWTIREFNRLEARLESGDAGAAEEDRR